MLEQRKGSLLRALPQTEETASQRLERSWAQQALACTQALEKSAEKQCGSQAWPKALTPMITDFLRPSFLFPQGVKITLSSFFPEKIDQKGQVGPYCLVSCMGISPKSMRWPNKISVSVVLCGEEQADQQVDWQAFQEKALKKPVYGYHMYDLIPGSYAWQRVDSAPLCIDLAADSQAKQPTTAMRYCARVPFASFCPRLATRKWIPLLELEQSSESASVSGRSLDPFACRKTISYRAAFVYPGDLGSCYGEPGGGTEVVFPTLAPVQPFAMQVYAQARQHAKGFYTPSVDHHLELRWYRQGEAVYCLPLRSIFTDLKQESLDTLLEAEEDEFTL